MWLLPEVVPLSPALNLYEYRSGTLISINGQNEAIKKGLKRITAKNKRKLLPVARGLLRWKELYGIPIPQNVQVVDSNDDNYVNADPLHLVRSP